MNLTIFFFAFTARQVHQDPQTRHVWRMFQTQGRFVKLKGLTGRENED